MYMKSRCLGGIIGQIISKVTLNQSSLENFKLIKTRMVHIISAIHLISILAPNASAILFKKDKLGVLVPFSSLAMEGCRVPIISAS